jgi:oxygen-dependent protoporphyrinogen oxidase
MHTEQYDIVIIGAGLTGLSLAHYLRNDEKRILVLDKKDRPGGVIHTHREDGFTYEEGPNTGIVKYGEVAEMFDALKEYCKPYIPDDSVKKRYIWKRDRWEELPSGLFSGIKTPLFSWKDKIRILGEPFRKPGKDPEETLEEMVKRRMGKTFLHYAVDPFILGVYAGDPSKIVPSYALPRLYRLEQDYGSFIGGAIRKKLEKKGDLENKATKDVFSMEGGLERLIYGLYESARPGRFRFNVESTRVAPRRNYFEVSFRQEKEEHHITADKVISTVEAYDLPHIMEFLSEEERGAFTSLRYAKVIQAAIGFKEWEGPELKGFGGLVPFIENRDILGALFMSAFLPGRAPKNGALLSVFMGGIRREDIYNRTDREVTGILEREMRDMFGLQRFNPDLLKIMRYENAIPQYGKESRERLRVIRELQERYHGLIIAGNLRDGIGMADRIKQASDIAATLHS